MENKQNVLTCSLSTPQLQKRKQTVSASLKENVLRREELSNGYAYQFRGTDEVLDEILIFIKTERQCCTFFEFNLSVHREGSVWLELRGPNGAKKFIDAEVGM